MSINTTAMTTILIVNNTALNLYITITNSYYALLLMLLVTPPSRQYPESCLRPWLVSTATSDQARWVSAQHLPRLRELKETTGGEFRVYRASTRLL